MKIHQVSIIEGNSFIDERGSFVKLFTNIDGVPFKIKEIYYSQSKKSVIRGMHGQKGDDFWKAICLVEGDALDVLIDVRKSSPTYGIINTFELKHSKPKIIIIPPGVLHGFQSLSTNCKMMYLVGDIYKPSEEIGINPLSININWPIKPYIISDRDKNLKKHES